MSDTGNGTYKGPGVGRSMARVEVARGSQDHGIWSHHFMANRWGNNGNSEKIYFWGAPKSLQMVTAAMKLKDACSLE